MRMCMYAYAALCFVKLCCGLLYCVLFCIVVQCNLLQRVCLMHSACTVTYACKLGVCIICAY